MEEACQTYYANRKQEAIDRCMVAMPDCNPQSENSTKCPEGFIYDTYDGLGKTTTQVQVGTTAAGAENPSLGWMLDTFGFPSRFYRVDPNSRSYKPDANGVVTLTCSRSRLQMTACVNGVYDLPDGKTTYTDSSGKTYNMGSHVDMQDRLLKVSYMAADMTAFLAHYAANGAQGGTGTAWQTQFNTNTQIRQTILDDTPAATEWDVLAGASATRNPAWCSADINTLTAAQTSQATYNLIGAGACRTSSGGTGAFTLATDATTDTLCQAACSNNLACLAYEFQQSTSECEIHTETISTVQGNSDYSCYVKQAPGGVCSQVDSRSFLSDGTAGDPPKPVATDCSSKATSATQGKIKYWYASRIGDGKLSDGSIKTTDDNSDGYHDAGEWDTSEGTVTEKDLCDANNRNVGKIHMDTSIWDLTPGCGDYIRELNLGQLDSHDWTLNKEECPQFNQCAGADRVSWNSAQAVKDGINSPVQERYFWQVPSTAAVQTKMNDVSYECESVGTGGACNALAGTECGNAACDASYSRIYLAATPANPITAGECNQPTYFKTHYLKDDGSARSADGITSTNSDGTASEHLVCRAGAANGMDEKFWLGHLESAVRIFPDKEGNGAQDCDAIYGGPTDDYAKKLAGWLHYRSGSTYGDSATAVTTDMVGKHCFKTNPCAGTQQLVPFHTAYTKVECSGTAAQAAGACTSSAYDYASNNAYYCEDAPATAYPFMADGAVPSSGDSTSTSLVQHGTGHCELAPIYRSSAYELEPSLQASGEQRDFETPEYARWVKAAWTKCLEKNENTQFVSVWTDGGYQCFMSSTCDLYVPSDRCNTVLTGVTATSIGYGCNSIQDRDTCLASRDGRTHESGKVNNQPCVWCGTETGSCGTNGSNKCEPYAWLADVGKFKANTHEVAPCPEVRTWSLGGCTDTNGNGACLNEKAAYDGGYRG